VTRSRSRKCGNTREVTEHDVLDIHKVQSLDEIIEFLYTPKPFCRYCNRRGVELGIPYGISKKEISEWA